MLLWAQEGSSVPGWGTAATIMGLLTGLLYWVLYVFIPATRKDTKELIDAHLAAEKEQRKDFREALEVLIAANKEQIQGLANALKEDLKEIEKQLSRTRVSASSSPSQESK